MEYALRIGLAAGIIIGLLHAAYVFRHVLYEPSGPRRLVQTGLRACYYALWTVLLWTLLGTYVLFVWMVALVPYATSRLVVLLRANAVPRTARRETTCARG